MNAFKLLAVSKPATVLQSWTKVVAKKIKNKNLKNRYLNCHFFLNLKGKEIDPFLVSKIETFCKPAFLSHPHHSMLGVVRRRGAQFHVSTLSRGVGDDFTVRCYLFIFFFIYFFSSSFFFFFFLQQFCPIL